MPEPHILIAADSFKGSMTSAQAGAAIRRGLASGLAALQIKASFDVIPIADGGEGTVDAFHAALGGELIRVHCRGPLGDPVPATFLLLPDGKTAVIEMAASCGLPLVKRREDILHSDTFGLGQQILAALDRQPDKILIGIGGSATNDAGAGMARALGARFRDAAGRELGSTPAELARLHVLDCSGLDARIRQTRFEAMCDVDNPLLGPAGAAAIFAPQKGAGPDVVKELETVGRRYAGVVERMVGSAFRDLPGAGAAGGLGFGLSALLGARLRPGISLVIETARLRERACPAQLLITGEGRLDSQSLRGKAPSGIAAIAAELGRPCIAFCGSLGGVAETLVPRPFAAAFEMISVADSVEDAIARGPECLETLARRHADDLRPLLFASGPKP
jgi:glycerate 2-kinase